VALSLLLAIGAGLFVRTLENLRNLDPGFRREGVLVANVDGQRAGYRDAALLTFYRELLERIQQLPGVASASLSASTPLGDVSLSTDVTIQGKIEEQKANLHLNMVTPRYFETMQMPLVQGRDFTIRDDATAPKVAMVNEAFVRRYFPGEPLLGRRISIGVSTGKRDEAEIVGAVRDTVAESLRQVPPAAVFLPYFQGGPQQFNTLEVRANGSVAQVLTVVRDELLAKLHTPPDVRTLTAMAERTLVQERLMATLAGAFGVLALVLACVGLYGLLAYNVAQRTKEMGIRMALGAQRRRVIGMVVKSAIRLVIIGIALGLPAAWAASRLVKSMLFGLTPTDPATMAGAALVMVSAALLAAYFPARRAARVDPMTALRHE
jgi:predicted permease